MACLSPARETAVCTSPHHAGAERTVPYSGSLPERRAQPLHSQPSLTPSGFAHRSGPLPSPSSLRLPIASQLLPHLKLCFSQHQFPGV